MQTEVGLCRSTEVKATHLLGCWGWGLGVPPGKAHGGGVFRLIFQEEWDHANTGRRRKAVRPRHRVCTLHEWYSGNLKQEGLVGQNQQDILLVLKISQGVTWNCYFLAVSGEDSSLLLNCSLRAEPDGTLSWPIAIRIFLRESPWTKKSVFSFLWKLWCSLWKQRNLDSVQEKCNLQTNSLGKSVPHPQCLGQAQGEPHPPLLSSWRPFLFPLLYAVSGCPKAMPPFLASLFPAAQGPSLCKCLFYLACPSLPVCEPLIVL